MLFVQCQSEEEKPKRIFNRVLVKEINTSIPIPATYEAYSILGYKKLLQASLEDSLLCLRLIKHLEITGGNSGKTLFWVEKNNPVNFISLAYGQIPVMYHNPPQMNNALASEKNRLDTVLVKEVRMLSNKYYERSDFKFIKSKFKHNMVRGSRYHTDYTILTPSHTFSIEVVNNMNKDHQSMIEKIKILKTPK